MKGTNLSHIDKWYVDEYTVDRGGIVCILAGTTLSDHAPIILQLADSARATTNSSVWILLCLLAEESLYTRVEEVYA